MSAMAKDNRYGICNYDFNGYNPKIENLEQFETYEEAADAYFRKYMEYRNKEGRIPDNLWLVYIENNRIVQFDRLARISKCKIVELK